MICQKCSKKMRQLFISWVCDYCDGLASAPTANDPGDFRGFIVLRKDRDLPCEEYVFATRADAERWKDLNGLFDADVKQVMARKPFRWQPSRGTVRGIILADALHQVHATAEEMDRVGHKYSCYVS
jgi:hypothetical protein